MFSTFATARLGEQIIFDLLPGSEWKNPISESREYFDIVWQGIKIDVKTTKFRLKSGFQTSVRASQTGKKDVVFVVVAMDGENQFFWVMKESKTSVYLKIKDAIPIEKLQEKIIEVSKTL